MGYERYPRGANPQGDYYGRTDPQDYGEDYGSGRDFSYSSARDYEAAGEIGQRRGGYGNRDQYGSRGGSYANRNYGGQDYGNDRYGQRDQFARGRDYYGGRNYQNNQPTSYDRDDFGTSGNEYHGSYGSGSRRFEDYGRYRHADDDNYNDPDQRWETRGRQGGQNRSGRDYGRQPQGYDYRDRGFFARAGDEVRSWFGDDDAERRREADARYEERQYGQRDADYHNWRSGQMASLDRDYDEYRRENRSKFENEFSSWRTNRQTQRDSLNSVKEHMDVVGSDGEHVGTVDKVRGDRILLTKNDKDAGGQHHSIPSSWLQTVDTKVTLSKTAAEAKKAWTDEDNNSAMFNYGDKTGRGNDDGDVTRGGRTLNRSFSGTY